MDRYIRIYKESDFDFQYKLDSAHLSTPFKFIFFTTDINDSSYECSFDGEEYIRCTRVSEDSIVFHIDGGVFECGNLRIRKEYFIDSSSFEDGICNSVDIEKTNIYIIEEGSNANSVVYTGSTLPNFDAMLIEQNVERAILILNQKSDEVDQEMSYVILVKDEMEGLLSYATEWEDRIERIENTYATTSYVQNKIDSIDFSPYPTFTDISNMGYLTSIPSEYITQEELSSNAYLTQHQSLANYPTFDDVSNMGYATKSYVQNKIDAIPQPDLSPYATKSYVVDYVATYAPQPDLSPYATKSYTASNYPTYTYVKNQYTTYDYIDTVVEGLVIGQVDLRDYVKKEQLNAAGYISSIPSEYITQEELSSNAYLTEHQSLEGYATESYVVDYVATYAPQPDLSPYATKSYVADYVATYSPPPDLSSYVTYSYLEDKHYLDSVPSEYITQEELSSNAYLTQHQSLDAYVTKAQLNSAGYISSIPSEYITQAELSGNSYLTQHQSLANYPTFADISAMGYLTSVPSEYVTDTELSNTLANYYTDGETDAEISAALANYYTKTDINNAGYISSIPSEYITQAELSANSYLTEHQDLSDYPTYSYVNSTFPTYTYVQKVVNLLVWQGTYNEYNNLPLVQKYAYQLYLIQQ